MQNMTIGQLARQVGIGIETVRFYERKGLIEQPLKPLVGYRRYPPQTATRLRFIRRAKELGFTLDEIGELLELRSRPTTNRERVRSRSRAKIEDIDRRIADLARMRSALTELVEACEHDVDTSDCPILAALEDDPNQEEQ